MTILGIETSCDDTCAAILVDGVLRSNVRSSQPDHDLYGGVVPEVASRAHQRNIVPVVRKALDDAGADLQDLSAIGVTTGPGLAGALLVGLSFAKGLAYSLDIPAIGVNHLEGHLYTPFLSRPAPDFPYLCLVASGGHTQLVRVDGRNDTTVLGRTRDDAAGEAFDKVAQLLGLPYPGGPEIDRHAQNGDTAFHEFARSQVPGHDFSFSGIKTSVLYYLNSFSQAERDELLRQHIDDICASFQNAVVDMLVGGIETALDATGVRRLAIVGGVSANTGLRQRASEIASARGVEIFLPPLEFCTDNAAMIALAAYFQSVEGRVGDDVLMVEPALAL